MYLKNSIKWLLGIVVAIILTACGGGSDTSTDTSTDNDSITSSDLIGVWDLDSVTNGTVTISFKTNGRGESYISVPGYQSETRAYSYRRNGTVLEFKYDETGRWDTPSEILSLTKTHLKLHNPDNTIGDYTKVSSGGSGGGTSTSATITITDSCDDDKPINYKFYDETNNLVWPSNSSHYTTYEYGYENESSLSCSVGAKICFGGETDARYWGVGLDGKSGCEDCCITCAEDVEESWNLTCSS